MTLLINLSILKFLGRAKTALDTVDLLDERSLLPERITNEPKVIYPIPPSWIKIRIINSPKKV
jgi:hypothetical protein